MMCRVKQLGPLLIFTNDTGSAALCASYVYKNCWKQIYPRFPSLTSSCLSPKSPPAKGCQQPLRPCTQLSTCLHLCFTAVPPKFFPYFPISEPALHDPLF